MTILDELAGHARERTEEAKRRIPPELVRRQALSLPRGTFSFQQALNKEGLSFICECKKASQRISHTCRLRQNMRRRGPTPSPF